MAAYDWTDTRASTWYEGYDDKTNAGSFVNLKDLKGKAGYDEALTAVTENVIGLFEQKGLTRAQAQSSQQFKDIMTKAGSGDTKGAFQDAAKTVTSAETRGDLWGADASEGGDEMRGKSFFDNVDSSTSISDLYTQGFDRTGDDEGIAYWESQLAKHAAGEEGGMDINQIASFFKNSEEAQVRDVYHEQYGRDIDAEGTAYWLGHTGPGKNEKGQTYDEEWAERKAAAGDDVDWTQSKNWGSHQVVNYADEVDRIITHRDASGQATTAETAIRDTAARVLGQTSNTADRKSAIDAGYFTAMENTGVAKWMGEIQAGTTSLQDVKDKLIERANIMDTYNVFDVDDWDEDGAQPTNMGRFGSLKDIKTHIDSGDSLEDLATRLGATTWGALSNEKFKDPKDFDYGGIGDPYTPGDDTWRKDRKVRTTPGEGWTPDIPDKRGSHQPFTATEKEIDYMPTLTSDVQDKSEYATAKGQYDTAMAAAEPTTTADGKPLTAAPQNISQRLTGTSAQGVRMKRSKVSQSGQAQGTGQFKYKRGKAQSLNLS